MNKEYLEAFNRITLHTEYDNDGYYDYLKFEEDCNLVDNALQRLEFIDNLNPGEALECLDEMYELSCDSRKPEHSLYTTVKQALIQAEQDKKKLNEIEKLTHLLYSERRKIGQEYVKWCKENNTVFNDETNMVTWILAIKLKEWLKSE